jgi:hypothetical protein
MTTPRCATEAKPEGCRDCVYCLSALPEGQTCATCAHAYRCDVFGYTDSPENTYCSFVPSRFRPAVVP